MVLIDCSENKQNWGIKYEQCKLKLNSFHKSLNTIFYKFFIYNFKSIGYKFCINKMNNLLLCPFCCSGKFFGWSRNSSVGQNKNKVNRQHFVINLPTSEKYYVFEIFHFLHHLLKAFLKNKDRTNNRYKKQLFWLLSIYR